MSQKCCCLTDYIIAVIGQHRSRYSGLAEANNSASVEICIYSVIFWNNGDAFVDNLSSWSLAMQHLRDGLGHIFYVGDNEKIQIKMMRSCGYYRIGGVDKYNSDAIEFPYDVSANTFSWTRVSRNL